MKRNTVRKAFAGAIALVFMVAPNLALRTSAAAAPDVDLSNELRNINSFLGSISQFDTLVSSLKLRGHATASERANIASIASNVKNSTSGAVTNIRNVISKLKSAGLWDALDASILNVVKSAKLRNFIQQQGGAKKILEGSVATLADLPGDIDASVREINALAGLSPAESPADSFLGYRVLRAAYGPEPAPFGLKKIFKCLVSATAFVVAAAKNTNPQSVQVAEQAFDSNC